MGLYSNSHLVISLWRPLGQLITPMDTTDKLNLEQTRNLNITHWQRQLLIVPPISAYLHMAIFDCYPANNIWLQQRFHNVGEVGTLSCGNIFQESIKYVAATLPQNVVRKHLHNFMATFIQRRSVTIFTMLWQPFCKSA